MRRARLRNLLVGLLRALEAWPKREIKSYDPSQVKITFNGIEIHGFMDGSFIKVGPEDDDVGVGGMSTGVKTGTVQVMSKGKVWVGVDQAASAGDLAQLGDQVVGTWLTSANAGGLALMEVALLADIRTTAPVLSKAFLSVAQIQEQRIKFELWTCNCCGFGAWDAWEWTNDSFCQWCGVTRAEVWCQQNKVWSKPARATVVNDEYRFPMPLADWFLVEVAAELERRRADMAVAPVSRGHRRRQRIADEWVALAMREVAMRGPEVQVALDALLSGSAGPGSGFAEA